ncbi:hypothetical protein [Flammeovirga sp. OC4]|uniref:hypothetical protein n=1 Tax=Flammeovirga sp. OC4 TaxID=1382345 RepID=UPI0005C55B0C|nr:hypothetical protein [Flammeovirga sp. OC4]
MSTDDKANNNPEDEKEVKKKVRTKRSLARRLTNLFVIFSIAFVTLFLSLIISLHIILQYYPDEFIGGAIKESVTRGTQKKYSLDYDKIHVKLISGWSIHDFLSSGSITLINPEFTPDSAYIAFNDSVPLGQKKNLVKVKLNKFELQNFSILRAVFQKEIYIGNVLLDSADIEIHKYKIEGQRKKEAFANKTLTETLNSLFYQNKENLKRYRIGNVMTINSSLNYFDHTQKIKQQIALDEISITLKDIYLDSLTLEQKMLPLHVGDLEFNTRNIKLELKDSPFGISLGKIDFSTIDSSLLVFNTSLYRINEGIDKKIPINNATIPLLSLEGLDIRRFLFDSSLYIKELSIVKPQVELTLHSSGAKGKKGKTPELPKFLKEISIQKFHLESAKIPFETNKLGKRQVNDISINIDEIAINDEILKEKIPVGYQNFDVKLKYQRWDFDNKHYAKVGGLYYHSKWQKLYLYSPAYKPIGNVPDSTSQTYISAQAKKITLNRVDYNFFLQNPLDSLFAYNHLLIDDLKTEVWLPTHPIEKVNKENKKKKNISIALNSTLLKDGELTINIPKEKKYKDQLTIQDIELDVDSLHLPLLQPKYFKIHKANVDFKYISLPQINNYDFLIEEMAFTTNDSSLAIAGLNISTEDSTASNLNIESYVQGVHFSHITWRKYLFSDSLIIDDIFVDIPSSDIEIPLKKAIASTKNITKDSLNKITPKKAAPFKYLMVNDFHLRKGPLTITKEDTGILGRSESMGVDIVGFTLEDKKFDWEDINFVVEDIYVPIRSINHKSSIDKISLNVEKQTLKIKGTALTPIDQDNQMFIKALTGIDNINIDGLDLRMLKDIQQLNADQIGIDGVRGVIAIDERWKPESDTTATKSENQKEFLKYLGIENINLRLDDFALLHTDQKGQESYLTFFGGELDVHELRSKASAQKNIGDIRPKNIFLKMKGLQYERDISPYVISSSELVIDSGGDSILISEANILPKMGSKSVGIIDSLFLLQVEELQIKGAGLKSFAYDKKIDIDTIYTKKISYLNPAKTKKVKKTGTFAEKNFPKEKVVALLDNFESIAIDYIQVDSSSVSFRSPSKDNNRKNISRLMRRKRTETPLNSTELSPKELNKYSKKTNRISNNKRYSKEKKKLLIDNILAETKGNPIDVYTLAPTEDSLERLEHQKSFQSVYNENSIKDINLKIEGVYINQETIQSERDYIKLGRINLNLGKNIFNLNNGMYAIGFDSLHFNNHYEDVYLKNFALVPRYSKKLFGIVNEYQTDRIEIGIDDLLLRGFHFKNYLFTDHIHLNGVEIDRLNLSAYRDKTVPVDPNKKNPKMIHTIFEETPLAFRLDTITITDSHINYEEYKGNIRAKSEDQELEGKSGQFQLNDFTGQIFNITNDTAKLADDPYMEMYVKGILMEEGGELKMYFRIPPLDSLGTYYYEGEVGKMDLIKLNPLVERLELVKIKDGNLKRMYFKVLADDSVAMGNMQFRYKNLEVDVLKDKAKKTGELKRRAFLSSVANLLIREENPRFPSMKQGHIYYERDTTKFIFNFWVKTVLTGVASTLSPLMEPEIPKKDKATKMEIRYIEKNTKRKNRLKGPLKKVY